MIKGMNSISKKFYHLVTYLFVLSLMLDPTNSILRLKVPLFLIFVFSLAINYKPDYKYMPHIVLLAIVNAIAFSSGTLAGQEFDYNMTVQYLIFFLLFICLIWRKSLDVLTPIIFSSVIVSVITVISFISFTAYPELSLAIYDFSSAHDQFIMIGERNFLGVEFRQVFYKSVPVIIFPAAYCFYKFVYIKSGRLKYFMLTILFMFALFCGGNRSLLGSMFAILFFVAYKKISKHKLFVPVLLIILTIASYIFFLAITDASEASTGVKIRHMQSFYDYFSDKWYLLPFGSGAGAYFDVKDYGFTTITEMTYMELIRMYGLIGLCIIMYFFLIPLFNNKTKAKKIMYWRPFSISYIIYLIISGSNPYLISSTGFISVLLMFTVISNPKYLIQNENRTKI